MEDLVGHPSNIPLHVGLHGEEAKTPMLGAGLCPNYTNARAILSDAGEPTRLTSPLDFKAKRLFISWSVALVRGDRFYTVSLFASGRPLHEFLFITSSLTYPLYLGFRHRRDYDRLGISWLSVRRTTWGIWGLTWKVDSKEFVSHLEESVSENELGYLQIHWCPPPFVFLLSNLFKTQSICLQWLCPPMYVIWKNDGRVSFVLN